LKTHKYFSACALSAVALFAISTTTRAEIRLVGASDADWTVLTISPDGSWGTATEGYLNRAIASAIERCRAMSRSALGCGAYQVSVQNGWALGMAMRAGKHSRHRRDV